MISGGKAPDPVCWSMVVEILLDNTRHSPAQIVAIFRRLFPERKNGSLGTFYIVPQMQVRFQPFLAKKEKI